MYRMTLTAISFLLTAWLVSGAGPVPELKRPGPEFSIRGPGKVAMITVKGKLVRVAAIGGETTGWAVELESEIKFDGKNLKRIEVDPGNQDAGEFVDKRVELKGRPTWVGGGPERGFYPIIEIADIRELSS